MTGPLSSDDVSAADMVLFRISPPAAPDAAIDLLRRYAPEDWDAAGGRYYVLVDVAAEDPQRALAAALVVNDSRPGVASLVALAVDPALRRQGLATRLISDIRRSLHAGTEVLELRTDDVGPLTKILHGLGFAEDPDSGNGDYAAGPVGRPVRWLSLDN